MLREAGSKAFKKKILRSIWWIPEAYPQATVVAHSRVGDARCAKGCIPTVAIYAFVQQQPTVNPELALHVLCCHGI